MLTIAQADDLRIAEKPNRPTGCGRPSSGSGAAERRLFDTPDGDRTPESEVVLQGGDSIETALTYREHRRNLTVFEPANPDAERCQVGDLTPLGKVVIAAISTAPALLVTSIVGLVNEVLGDSHKRLELGVTRVPLRTDQDFLNAELPANVCWAGDRGWKHAHGIQLSDGTGIALASDGSFEGASVLRSSVLGRADVDGDGSDEVVMSLLCSGSPPEYCCAGRSSTMFTVAVFTVENGDNLKQIAPSLMGGSSGPGDRFGPAGRKITSAELNGSTIITEEWLLYPEHYTSDQVGGNPFDPVVVEYRLADGSWVASRP